MSPISSLKKLDHSNYSLWKFKITSTLDAYSLLEILDGTCPRPKKYTRGSIGALTEQGNSEFHQWQAKIQSTAINDQFNLSHSALSLVIGQKTSRLWETHEEGTPPFLDPMFLDWKEN